MSLRNTTSFVWPKRSLVAGASYYLCEVSTIRDLDTSGEKLHQDLLGRGLKRYLFFALLPDETEIVQRTRR